jgi:phosphoglucomutase
MFAELAACARSLGLTIPALLDRIYSEFGYFLEMNHSKIFEGAEGAAKIQKLADSYSGNPPSEVDGAAVSQVRDFAKGGISDEEGETIPREKMLFIHLADGRSFAVRPSGTEPKIKYYLFGQSLPEGGAFDGETLAREKQKVAASLDSLWQWLEADITARLA